MAILFLLLTPVATWLAWRLYGRLGKWHVLEINDNMVGTVYPPRTLEYFSVADLRIARDARDRHWILSEARENRSIRVPIEEYPKLDRIIEELVHEFESTDDFKTVSEYLRYNES